MTLILRLISVPRVLTNYCQKEKRKERLKSDLLCQ